MNEAPVRTFEQFQDFIREETDKARNEAQDHINNTGETSVGCVDPKTRKKAWNPPGGVVFLANEGKLSEYMAKREGKSGELEAHLDCGYMLVIMGLNTRKAQMDIINKTRQLVTRLNKQFHTNFSVPKPEAVGSANPYMKA